jgi:hypothetical protein
VTRTRTRTLVTFLVVAAGLAAVALLLSSLFGDDGAAAGAGSESATATARHRAVRRVPKLRVAGTQPPGGAHGFPAPQAVPPPQLLPAKTRLAPLLSFYQRFLDDTQMDPSSLRELRRILHGAHQRSLRNEQLAAQNLGESGSAQARREKALRDLEVELQGQIRPEEVERVMAHPFVPELLASNEPLFQANRRGIVNVRDDLGHPPGENDWFDDQW